MQIKWYGNSCFRIQAKTDSGESMLVTDPYSDAITGLKKPKLGTDVATVSGNIKEMDLKSIKGTDQTPEPFVVQNPGEYEFKNIFVYGIPGTDEKKENIIYVISAENITIAHLGDFNQKELTNEQLEIIENSDILMIPVGGKSTLTASEAVKIIGQVEPRIVIPMSYNIPGLKTKDLDPVDKFVKEMGNNAETVDKLKILKKDLPQEDTQIIILEI